MKGFFKIFLSFLSLIFFLLFVSEAFSYEDKFEKRLNLWPFIVYSKNKITKTERLEIAGPFIYKYSLPKENGTSFRPLCSSVKISNKKKVYFISPLGLYKSDNETATLKVVPLIKKTWTKNSEESQGEKYFELFPIFWGKTSQNEIYGGIFPIYGNFKNKFGRKEIIFVLWPLYSKIKYEKYSAYNYVWPFIRTVKKLVEKKEKPTSSEYSGFKIWPFFGHFKENNTERSFILWPFYIKESFKDPEGDFSNKLMVFPFYIKEDTESYNRKIILWPFFQRVYAKDHYYKQLDAPWPFYRKIEGEEIKGLRYWPFYGYVKKNDSSDYFILWPLYFYKEDYIQQGNLNFTEKEHRFLIFSKYRHTIHNNQLLQKEYRIWPLVYGYKNQTNSTTTFFYFPAILPFYDEGLDRNYSAFLRLLEYYQHDDYTFFKLLWGIYRYEKFKHRSVQELAFIFRMVNGPDTNYVEFLEGLFGFGKLDGKPTIKIFFINLATSSDNNKSTIKNTFSKNDKQKNRYLSWHF